MSHRVGVRPTGARQVIRAVSDGTGRSPDEVVILAVATATVVITVAAGRSSAWAVDAMTNVDPWPAPPGRLPG